MQRLVREAGALAAHPGASCEELQGALDRLHNIECTLKSFLTEENCRAYARAVAGVRERFQGRYEAVQAVLAGLEGGGVHAEGLDAFQQMLDDLQHFPRLQSHVAWAHAACHAEIVARMSSAVQAFSDEFLSTLSTSAGLGVEEFSTICLGLQTAVSVLRFAARLDDAHDPDAKGRLDECTGALDAVVLRLFCEVDTSVGGDDFEGVASGLGKLLLIASTLKPDALFSGQCAGKRAFIVNHLHGLVAKVSADLDWFSFQPQTLKPQSKP